ncbi:unnamed protein product [Prorocentrum cordatum]|uniref:Uncharacterized protein n=1 Tax=Prorocentrum cordatum TaxID=2364126 RepID=A0ABN9SIP1_9DINO|nr:unnamed protein product [Polarella glacialis]
MFEDLKMFFQGQFRETARQLCGGANKATSPCKAHPTRLAHEDHPTRLSKKKHKTGVGAAAFPVGDVAAVPPVPEDGGQGEVSIEAGGGALAAASTAPGGPASSAAAASASRAPTSRTSLSFEGACNGAEGDRSRPPPPPLSFRLLCEPHLPSGALFFAVSSNCFDAEGVELRHLVLFFKHSGARLILEVLPFVSLADFNLKPPAARVSGPLRTAPR